MPLPSLFLSYPLPPPSLPPLSPSLPPSSPFLSLFPLPSLSNDSICHAIIQLAGDCIQARGKCSFPHGTADDKHLP